MTLCSTLENSSYDSFGTLLNSVLQDKLARLTLRYRLNAIDSAVIGIVQYLDSLVLLLSVKNQGEFLSAQPFLGEWRPSSIHTRYTHIACAVPEHLSQTLPLML